MATPTGVQEPGPCEGDFADVPEASLLERPPGSPIRLLDRGDDRAHRRVDEDDVAGERGQNARSETMTDEIRLADQKVDARHVVVDLDELLPFGWSATR